MAEPATQCRGNVVAGEGGGGGGGMRTVECLRGRLLAERVASKAAKEEADQLAARLDELEKKLSDEVKIRNKAERRLRRAIKRLESLKILDVELSESSLGSLSSNGGCSSSSHHVPETEERNENDPGSLSTVDSGLRGGEEKGWDGSSAGSCTQVNSSQDGSWFSVVSEQSGSGLCKGGSRVDPDDAKNGDSAGGVHDGSEREEQEERPAASSGSSSKSEDGSYRDEADDRLALVLVGDPHHEGGSATEGNTDRSKEGEEEENNKKLAIVLADPQPRRDAESGSGANDVQSVLLALQRVKEQLRYTIQRRSEAEGLVAHRELYGH